MEAWLVADVLVTCANQCAKAAPSRSRVAHVWQAARHSSQFKSHLNMHQAQMLVAKPGINVVLCSWR